MIEALGGAVEARAPASRSQDRLRDAAEQMEGLFVQHLTKALRATLPDGGNPDAPGADMYGSLLDEHLAQVVAQDTRSGIAEALYRQLSAIASQPRGQENDSPTQGSDE